MACTISCRLHSVVQVEAAEEEALPPWVAMVMAATIDKTMARFDIKTVRQGRTAEGERRDLLGGGGVCVGDRAETEKRKEDSCRG